MAAYLTSSEADALAATLPAAYVAAYVALASSAVKDAHLLAASDEVDAACRWQGRKYDPDQERQFPRVPYATSSVVPGAYPIPSPGGSIADQVWDWDADANGGSGGAVVPADVLKAVLYQADEIASGRSAERLANQHGGLASQSVGGVSESYVQGGGTSAGGLEQLSRLSAVLLKRFRLASGRFL